MISQKSKVINEYFMKELMQLIAKYNEIEESVVEKVEKIFASVMDEEVKGRLLGNLDKVIELAEQVGETVDEDVIKLYFFANDHVKPTTMEEAEELWLTLIEEGYLMLDMDTVLYADSENLKQCVEDRVEDILSDSYEVDRLMDKDTLIDYFIEGTSIGEVAREMIESRDDYEEILGIHPEMAFESSDGDCYYYAELV